MQPTYHRGWIGRLTQINSKGQSKTWESSLHFDGITVIPRYGLGSRRQSDDEAHFFPLPNSSYHCPWSKIKPPVTYHECQHIINFPRDHVKNSRRAGQRISGDGDRHVPKGSPQASVLHFLERTTELQTEFSDARAEAPQALTVLTVRSTP